MGILFESEGLVIDGNSTVYSVFLPQGILMFSLIKYTRITYEDYIYPPWGEAVGWLITVASMLCVPLLVIKTIVDIYWRGNDGGNTSQVSQDYDVSTGNGSGQYPYKNLNVFIMLFSS